MSLRLLVPTSLSAVCLAAVAHAQVIATAPNSNAIAIVNKYFEPGGQLLGSFAAYATTFTGGARVAMADINNDGVPDVVTGAGPGAGPQVKVFDGVTGAVIRDFFAYSPAFSGGVYLAAGHITSATRSDIVVSAGPGAGAQVVVYDGQTLAQLRSFFAFPGGFTGGVRLAVGDVNGDGIGDIIVGAGPGALPQVKAFDGLTGGAIRDFMAYPNTYTGGVFVAAGDLNGDGVADIVTGTDEGVGAAPHVKVFDGLTLNLIGSFFAFAPTFTGGVRVAVGDVTGDGVADIITAAGPGALPQVSAFSLAGTQLRTFNAYATSYTGGVFIASGSCAPTPCPPPNNECSGAVPLTLGVTTLGTSLGATVSATLPNNGAIPYCTQTTWSAGTQKDAFFRFTPAASGDYAVDTCGSTFDTILAVHSGCPVTSANLVSCNDDASVGPGNTPCSGSSTASRIPAVALVANTDYTIRVFGYAGATGAIAVTVNQALGACCAGTRCTLTTTAGCSGSYQGTLTTCGPAGNPTTCCPANFNGVNGLTVQDIFDFLNAWLANSITADFNHSGALSANDIFDFLGAWFVGC